MGDASTPLTQTEAWHLLRRTGFGGPQRPSDLEKIVGVPRGEAVDALLDFNPTSFKPSGRDIESVHNRWVSYMVRTRRPLQEKLVLFWHDHFATTNATVANQDLMGLQNRLLRQFCKGNFKDFVKAINKDPAMMEMLGTVRNQKAQPNENYARELQELFTLGVFDFAGNPTYTQADIVQIARAFSGWRYADNVAYLNGDDGSDGNFCNNGQHDYAVCYPARGPKVIYKTIGQFGPGGRDFTANGEGAAEIDTVIDIICAHRDTAGKNTVARHIASKLITYFAHPDPTTTFVDAVVTNSGFDMSFDLQALLRAVFVDDSFYDSAAPPGTGTKKSVKWPIDYVVGTLRLLKMKLKGGDQYVNAGSLNSNKKIRTLLTSMGQTLLEPPSVFGWDWETSWVSSAALLGRYSFARYVTAARGHGGTAFRPERLVDLALTDPGEIVDAVTDVLGVTGQFNSTERQALINYLGPGPLNLNDFNTRDVKVNGLFNLILQSPAYQLQ